MIAKWASEEYVEHLVRKRESEASGEYAGPRVNEDALLEASLANQPTLAPSKPKKKEHGV